MGREGWGDQPPDPVASPSSICGGWGALGSAIEMGAEASDDFVYHNLAGIRAPKKLFRFPRRPNTQCAKGQ